MLASDLADKWHGSNRKVQHEEDPYGGPRYGPVGGRGEGSWRVCRDREEGYDELSQRGKGGHLTGR